MDTLADPIAASYQAPTPEAVWLPWLARQPFAPINLLQLLGGTQRLLVVSPHPDDEVLAVGGLLAQAADRGCEVQILAVTDGEHSHPGSTAYPATALQQLRSHERHAALQHLHPRAQVQRLRFEDTRVADRVDALTARLSPFCNDGDLLLTTWRGDGHADHEATAQACLALCRLRGLQLVEVPVWAWQWASPGDPRLPWHRARVVMLDAEAVRRKQLALLQYASQLSIDPSTGRSAVISSAMVQRASRPFELLFA